MDKKQYKRLTPEETDAQNKALADFDCTPYAMRMVKVLSSSWKENDIGGIAVDLAKAWMALDCPHDEDFHQEIQAITVLETNLLKCVEKMIGTIAYEKIQKDIDPSFDADDEFYQAMPPLYSILSDYTWMWLPSYSECYANTYSMSLSDRESVLDMFPIPEKAKQRERHRIALERNCPYDSSRLDEQRYADTLLMDSLMSENDDHKEIMRDTGLRLGRDVYNAYPECKDDEEYRYVASRVCDGIRNKVFKAFSDSPLMRMDRISPLVLMTDLQLWANTEIIVLCEQNGKYKEVTE